MLYSVARHDRFELLSRRVGAVPGAGLGIEGGGASITSEGLRLDRHWHNARTISVHNPLIYKPQSIGNHVLNDPAAITHPTRFLDCLTDGFAEITALHPDEPDATVAIPSPRSPADASVSVPVLLFKAVSRYVRPQSH